MEPALDVFRLELYELRPAEAQLDVTPDADFIALVGGWFAFGSSDLLQLGAST
jgi:hypothetical protein